jgi:hypothetical protein
MSNPGDYNDDDERWSWQATLALIGLAMLLFFLLLPMFLLK